MVEGILRGYERDDMRSHLKHLYHQMRYQPTDFQRYMIRWQRISGWLSVAQARWLFERAKDAQPTGDIVEIGSAYGRSTVCLGWGTQLSNNGHIYAVDPHIGGKGFREQLGKKAETYTSLDLFKQNLARFNLTSAVTPVVATSEDAVTDWSSQSIRLLFIDGWHTYEAVRHDILAWRPYMVAGATIALHDYNAEGVKAAIHDSLAELGIADDALQHVDTMMVYFQV